jgi:vancomycin resistance protein YoaR
MDNESIKSIWLSRKLMYIYIILLISALYFFTACSGRGIQRQEESNEKLQKEAEINEQQIEMEKILQEEKEKQEDENRVKEDVTLEDTKIGGLSKEEALKIVKKKAAEIEKEPVNAKYNADTWEVIPGKMGAKVNVEETMKKVMDADEGEKVKLVVKEVAPEVTKDSFKDKVVTLSSYSTSIVDKSPDRQHNIELAISKIRDLVLYPNEEFSFNNRVGNRTEAEGYKDAIIIRRTEEGPKKEDGVGGGVCQLSTTIYKAAQACGLKIVERHNHSSEITYAEIGDDAAVSYGYLDFRFINNRSFPIMLKFSLDTDQLTVTIVENRMKAK